MCGIAGIVEYGSAEPLINEKILKSMSDVIVHRGPDADGLWVSPDRKCGFTFRRLAIIDLSPAGNQPMITPDGRHAIIFNGEIYNHMLIRKELESKGYEYHSKTDTETILYGFQEWGRDIVNKLVGMWGFAIWDNEKKELFCARDRIGIKPLYFYNLNGRFLFGSEIKSILQHPGVSTEFNIDELPNYLNFGMSGNRNSMFKNVHKIPAGHYLTLNKTGDVSLNRYWSPLKQNLEYTRMDEEEIKTEIVRLLRQAVKDRMMSDVPFGVFLSGGIDSSVNVALMAELMDRPVDTFTVGFKELEKYNELKYARQIAELFRTNHHEVLIDDKDSLPVLQELTWHEDEPNADPVCIPLYFLSKLTKESGTTVIQVGEGSDEQFAGYPWMVRDYNFFRTYWKTYSSMPDFIKKSIYHTSKTFMNSPKQLLVLDYIRRATYGDQFYWGGSSIFSPSHMEGLFNKQYHHLNNIPAAFAGGLHEQALYFKPDADYLQRIAFVELSERLSEILLMRVDKIGMAHSLEARVPFLDHRLVEFTMSIPPHIKVPDKNTTKYILKKAVEPILPHEIIYRKKQGFWAPVKEWIRYQWFDYTSTQLMDSKIMNMDIFNKGNIRILLDNHRNGKHNNGVQLFSLLTLSLWYDRFFK